MEVKNIWTTEDYLEMGWHDSYVHTISFPLSEPYLSFDIDYIFKWILDDNTQLYNFWVSPCMLTFFDILNVKIDLEFQNTIGLYISNINRSNMYLSPNGNQNLWNFEIITDKGIITFQSSGYELKVEKQPILTNDQTLCR